MIFLCFQVFAISGDLDCSNGIEDVLRFALKYSELDKTMKKPKAGRTLKLLYQITKDGKFCIGWSYVYVPEGWKEFPFKFSIKAVSKFIRDHLKDFPVEENVWAGSYIKGFLMKAVKEAYGDEFEGIKMPVYTVVYFEPFTCFYSK